MKPELLAPAGTLDILKIAFMYGADAVYCGTPAFAMRARVGFNIETLKEGILCAHSLNKKVYLTLNAFPHSFEIEKLEEHIGKLAELKPDAFIVADPGMIDFILKNFDIPVHLSTQASTTNQLTAEFWKKQGVERIVLARELSLKEIKKIHETVDIELETFIHGAMCMAYSGRCQISNYMTGRDPNRGQCVQACRFKYKMYALEEDLRKGELFPLYEDEEGTHILNSKDLCMIQYIPELIDAGIASLKIEGRLKSEYYVATVVRAYRKAIDLYYSSNGSEKLKKEVENLQKEVEKSANRGFTTGFYFDKPNQETNNYLSSRAESQAGYIGRVLGYDNDKKMLKFEVKNHLLINSKLEIFSPDKTISYALKEMFKDGQSIEVAHANNIVEIPLEEEMPTDSLIRILL
jgi:putative protease